MEELDDLDTGTSVDLWDHKLAAEMRQLAEIFAEVVDKNARVADNGRILDPQGRVIKDYSRSGLPAYLEFEVPAGVEYFTLDVNGHAIKQPLSDRAAGLAEHVVTATLDEDVVELPVAEEKPAATGTADEDANAEWRGIDLEFRTDGTPDVDLEKHKDD